MHQMIRLYSPRFTLKTEQGPMQVQGENKTKPPAAMQHRPVLLFPKSVPLYGMTLHTSSRLQDIL
jgi:hypothetical protein